MQFAEEQIIPGKDINNIFGTLCYTDAGLVNFKVEESNSSDRKWTLDCWLRTIPDLHMVCSILEVQGSMVGKNS